MLTPLLIGISALTISKELFNQEYLSAYEISEALDRMGYDIKRDQIARAFSNGKGRVKAVEHEDIQKYKVMNAGLQMVEKQLSLDHSEIVHVRPGTPYTSRRKLETILNELKGDVRIVDPYYGLNSLAALNLIPKGCGVRFLTSKPTGDQIVLGVEIAAFKIQNPQIEIRRIAGPNDLHDRYIIDDDHLLLVGHGIKDIGNKQSLIVQLRKQLLAILLLM